MATNKKVKNKGESRTTRKVSKGVVKKSSKTARDVFEKSSSRKRAHQVVDTLSPPKPKPTRSKTKK